MTKDTITAKNMIMGIAGRKEALIMRAEPGSLTPRHALPAYRRIPPASGGEERGLAFRPLLRREL